MPVFKYGCSKCGERITVELEETYREHFCPSEVCRAPMQQIFSPFNFAEWLSKMTYWEDQDTQLIFISTENGGISICDLEYNYISEGQTLEEACMNFEKVAHIEKK